MDSRRRESRQALLPFRAIDFLRPCCVLGPSGSSPDRAFLTMYLRVCEYTTVDSSFDYAYGLSSGFSPKSNRALFTTYLSSITSVRMDMSRFAASWHMVSRRT
jgi:hypothetical protein